MEIDDTTVKLAMDAAADYWNGPDRLAMCDLCHGTGLVACGDSQEYCDDCGGAGEIHDGTEEGAMRAALAAVMPQLRSNALVNLFEWSGA